MSCRIKTQVVARGCPSIVYLTAQLRCPSIAAQRQSWRLFGAEIIPLSNLIAFVCA